MAPSSWTVADEREPHHEAVLHKEQETTTGGLPFIQSGTPFAGAAVTIRLVCLTCLNRRLVCCCSRGRPINWLRMRRLWPE